MSKKLIYKPLLEKFGPNADHRVIGHRQNLFFFDDSSQGSCFFEPRGAHIYNKLMQYLRNQYKLKGYHEVITPNIYNSRLWEKSGHWDHYKDNMIKFQIHGRDFSLKPMNCPGHCIMFKHQGLRSKDQLPVRLADFGVLHRNELSGSLIGLTRVRRFQQDDAHIFCTHEQLESEVLGCLLFAKEVYAKFGFKFETELSLRPQDFLGDLQTWDKAEQALRIALQASQLNWNEDVEGAFYGPKIDLKIKDCFGRQIQCATIQLDFQMPERFNLNYKDKDDENGTATKRPVIIHRAILGSIERFIAMLAENSQGLWPFWLSPLQLQIVPVHPNFSNQAKRLCQMFRDSGFSVDCDVRPNVSLNAKIREAQMMPYNLISILGQQESDNDSLTIRIKTPAHNKKEDGSGEKKYPVLNLNMSSKNIIKLFEKFEQTCIDRADLELLDKHSQSLKDGH